MMKGRFLKEGFMNAFRMVVYGIVAAGSYIGSSFFHDRLPGDDRRDLGRKHR
jgi:hypothetical protein